MSDCQPHAQRRTLRAHATASGRQNWDSQQWSFQTGGSCPILKCTGTLLALSTRDIHSR